MQDKTTETMRAMAATRDDVAMTEIPRPAPGPGEVQVKVVAASVNAGEEKVLSGDFVGRFLHAKTSPLVLGWDLAGTVDTVGEGVTDIEAGTAVFGHLAFSHSQKQGSYAEYVTSFSPPSAATSFRSPPGGQTLSWSAAG